jgi:hypothetical protein
VGAAVSLPEFQTANCPGSLTFPNQSNFSVENKKLELGNSNSLTPQFLTAILKVSGSETAAPSTTSF